MGHANAMSSNNDTFAAIDLGSNSFHMIVARFVHDTPQILDRLRERVQLAWGLDEERDIDARTQTRALEALERVGERIRGLPANHVRAVGTNTLRQAKNARLFLKQAISTLGHHIEVISGQEEARLIYLGVAQALSNAAERRLVVDIGGGSTECIIGEAFEPKLADSLYMGCVSFTKRFFPDGKITADRMDAAELAAQRELKSIESRFWNLGWQTAVGSSGTVHAIKGILQQNGWTDSAITPKGLKKLRKALIQAGHADKLDLKGLKTERTPVIAGGLAVLNAVFESLGIIRMRAAGGALREGVLYDLVGRTREADVREQTVLSLMQHFHVDTMQSSRVEKTTIDFWEQIASHWDVARPDLQRLLTWAARLHEIGLFVSYTGHQKHGAYLIANSDLPGFSRDEQRTLAALILGHRRKIRASQFDELFMVSGTRAMRLCILLRLAVLLNRSRSGTLPHIELRAMGTSVMLRFPSGWLSDRPLIRADLEDEAEALRRLVHLKW